MMTVSEAKRYSKTELIELVIKEAKIDPPFLKSGKPHLPDGYVKSLAKRTKSWLIEEYNSLCQENSQTSN